MIQDGSSRVGTIAASLDYDTRSDPVLPRSGMRLALSGEVGTSLLGSSYSYVKTVFNGSVYLKMPHGHALGFHLFAGSIEGNAPYFDRFFIGDLDLLLPRRALGINFSTQPAPSFLGTSIAAQRYDNYAGRLLIEYAVPVWRHRGWVYGGDAFVAFGVLGMASDEDMLTSPPHRSDGRSRPSSRHLRRRVHGFDRQRAQPQLFLMWCRRVAAAVVLASALAAGPSARLGRRSRPPCGWSASPPRTVASPCRSGCRICSARPSESA